MGRFPLNLKLLWWTRASSRVATHACHWLWRKGAIVGRCRGVLRWVASSLLWRIRTMLLPSLEATSAATAAELRLLLAAPSAAKATLTARLPIGEAIGLARPTAWWRCGKLRQGTATAAAALPQPGE